MTYLHDPVPTSRLEVVKRLEHPSLHFLPTSTDMHLFPTISQSVSLYAKNRLPHTCIPRDIDICRLSATTGHSHSLCTPGKPFSSLSAVNNGTDKNLLHLIPDVKMSIMSLEFVVTIIALLSQN